MDTKRLTADLSVSPQITVDDVPMLKAAGFRAIISAVGAEIAAGATL